MITLDGRSLTPDQVAAAARRGDPVSLAEEARERNAAARRAIAEHLRRQHPLYGASTGVGAFRDRSIAEEDREQYQWNLLRSHAVTAGRPMAAELVRAGMVVRANQLGAGGAGVLPELLDGLLAALNRGVVPLTRELSSIGTGDLPAMAEIALAILGEGKSWRGEELIDAPVLVAGVRLGLRDALGFMSSNAITVGHASLLSVDVRILQDAWLAVAALSFEAFEADLVVLDERVQTAAGGPGQVAVARRMRGLLAGAPLAHDDPEGPVQHPYPFRVLPQVDGVTEEALTALDEVLTRALNARAENALIDDGVVLPNGNFHAAELAAALDRARAALAQSASLIAARISSMMDPRMTGLPPFLARQPGLESGVMMLEYTAQAAAAEVRSLALNVAVQNVGASLGVESHSSLAATSVRLTTWCLEAMRLLVATELVVTLRALRAADRTPGGAGTRQLFALCSRALPTGLEERAFGLEIEAAADLVRRWAAEGTD